MPTKIQRQDPLDVSFVFVLSLSVLLIAQLKSELLQVQKLALFAVGNFAFCLENRRALVTSESLRELLLRLTAASDPNVCKAAARALAVLGGFLQSNIGSYMDRGYILTLLIYVF